MTTKTKKYVLTDAHRAQLKPWADKYIANAMSTKPMDDEDRAAMRKAVRGMYEAAGLTPPPDHRIVFVSSPFVLRFAGGFAAAIWHMRKNAATRDATAAATAAATHAATAAATHAATDAATRAATYAATAAATYAATYAATDAATYAADSWTRMGSTAAQMSRLAMSISPRNHRLLLSCAQGAYRIWQGGNQWSGWTAFLSFFRHVARLPLDYSKWDHWEAATLHGGPRIMHKDFCMVSDRPQKLTVDEQNRPHNATGPFCEWADGSKLYAWHGVRVPSRWIEVPSELDPATALTWPNIEERRAAAEIIGWARVLEKLPARVIDQDRDSMIGTLIEVDLPDAPGERFLRVLCGTNREFVLPVQKTAKTALEANASTWQLEDAELLRELEVRT